MVGMLLWLRSGDNGPSGVEKKVFNGDRGLW